MRIASVPTHKDNNEYRDFLWPGDLSMKTQYRLIGYSVNVRVAVVSALITYLFEDSGRSSTA